MGSNMSSATTTTKQVSKPPELSALNAAEESSLVKLYNQVTNDGEFDNEKFCIVFSSETVPDYGHAMLEYIRGLGVVNVTSFLACLSKCTRGRPDDTIQFFWEICGNCNEISGNQLTKFIKLLLEFGKCKIEGIDETSILLKDHIVKHMSVMSDTDVKLKTLIEWGHDYAPFMRRLFVTYLNDVCFSDCELFSFVPFCPPLLEMNSNVVTMSALLPLALYTSSCQGKWKCIYTTVRDGISFNRIAHNILGYGVSFELMRYNIHIVM